jgi:hypothetical protein
MCVPMYRTIFYLNCFQVFFFMLVCRLVVDWQLRRKEQLKAEAAAITSTDDKQNKQD